MSVEYKSRVRVRIIVAILIFLALFSISLVLLTTFGVVIAPLSVLTTSIFSFSGMTILGNWVTPAGGFKSEVNK